MIFRRMGAGVALVLLSAGTAPAVEPVCGDVNDSGTVSSSDALLVLKDAVGQPVMLSCPAIGLLATCSDDLAMCMGDSCGDGSVNAVGEQCDGADLNGATCGSLSYDLGSLSCDGGCKFDASGCGKCTGLVYKNSCWFYGATAQNCSEVCAESGMVYDDATRTLAGSDGSAKACEVLLDDLGAPGTGLEFPDANCTDGIGCGTDVGLRGRCVTPTTTSSESAATISRVCACTSDCPGAVYGGACWFFGKDGQSCDTVCAGVGRTYDDATSAIAGSEGTAEACQIVLDKLEAPGSGLQFPAASCTYGTGCSEEGGLRGRCAMPATTSDASYPSGARACACQ